MPRPHPPDLASRGADRTARRVLWRHGIRDPAAVDDALSLVLDHLRRLATHGQDEPPVAPFDPHRATPGRGDAGAAYIAWLARDRAIDIARRRRRQDRLGRPLGDDTATRLVTQLVTHPAPIAEEEDRPALVRAAIARLAPQDRLVCELLLAGRSQATIAGLLGVCAGTVSRIRCRAIAALRDAIDRT